MDPDSARAQWIVEHIPLMQTTSEIHDEMVTWHTGFIQGLFNISETNADRVVNHLSMPNALVRAFIKETTNSVAKGGAALIEHTKTMSHGVKQLAKNPFGGTNATFCSSR